MEVRLVQLLTSFIATSSTYALARLEFAMQNPSLPAPPAIDRLSDASEGTLRLQWPAVERQLEEARRYLAKLDDHPRRKRAVSDRAFAALSRSVRELEQYARALRWVLTVEDRSQ